MKKTAIPSHEIVGYFLQPSISEAIFDFVIPTKKWRSLSLSLSLGKYIHPNMILQINSDYNHRGLLSCSPCTSLKAYMCFRKQQNKRTMYIMLKSLRQKKQYQKIGNITINKSFFAKSVWPNSNISPTQISTNLLPFGVPKTRVNFLFAKPHGSTCASASCCRSA